MAAATNPSATPINGLRTANQKEMFQSEFSGVGFLFMPLFSSVRRPTFQKGLKFFLHAILPRQVRQQDHATHETLELAERESSIHWTLRSHGPRGDRLRHRRAPGADA